MKNCNNSGSKSSNKRSIFLNSKILEFFKDKIEANIFIQKRVGKDGKILDIYKIRTMHLGADKNIPQEVLEGNKQPNDERIIESRKWMRKTGFDEIPQIVNILKGEMSFFGARPISQTTFDHLSSAQKTRKLGYKPGIFGGYAFYNKTKNGRKRNSFEDQDMYLRMRYIKEKQGKIPLIFFNTWIFSENIKALINGVNK